MIEYALLAACLEHGTEHNLIQAIAKQESNYYASALYINKWELDQFSKLNVDEAVLVAEKMVAEGYTVDVGLMGINSWNIERFGLTVRETYDPCTNINIGEQILFDNIQHAESLGHSGHDAIRVALSMYNTGSVHRGFKNGYVEKVWTHYSASISYEALESDITVPWDIAADLNAIERDKPAWLSEKIK